MISSMMGYSPGRVYTTAKTSPKKNFKHGWKNDMTTSMTTLLQGEFTRSQVSRSSSLDNLKPSNKELSLHITPT